MIIEIKGTGSHNKGAEMMLLTILQELQKSANTRFVVTPQIGSCEYGFYSSLGLYPKAWLEYRGIQLAKVAKILPQKIRSMYGLVLDNEIDAVLDASGFAYSDQWGERPSKIMAQYTTEWRKKGKKIILMPQAFGPFENKNNIESMRKIITNSDLIYARDAFSYESLLKIENNTNKIKQSPDFTMLLEGKIPNYFDKEKYQIGIVPNQRMLDKRSNSSEYIALFVKSIKYIQSKNLIPYFLTHGGREDYELSMLMNSSLDKKIEIINEDNPFYIKGIIKESLGLLGSRFHSIASALYSGTVAVGTGWSHKYKYLFDGFDFAEGLIDLDSSDKKLYNTLDLFINTNSRKQLSTRFISTSNEQKRISTAMFEQIKTVLGLT